VHDRILILDFGAQYTQLIARRVREARVYCEIHPCDIDDALVREFAPQGIILSGSHASAYEDSTLKAPKAAFELGVPVLGICYGMQTMAQQLGGRVEAGTLREFGYAEVRARGHTKLLDGIEDWRGPGGEGMLKVWMSHGDKVVEMPPGFTLMASTESCPIAGMADEARRYYGVQFHPEVTHTAQGTKLLHRFVRDVCGCRGDWNMPDYVLESIERIRRQVGDEEVILGLSGGVDSSVAAALIHRAIGKQLTCVFVDHGLLRLDEAKQVMDTFAKHMKLKVIRVDASGDMFAALKGVADPEEKRKVIGKLFVDVFQSEAKAIKNAKWLAQGTIYPDVIESAGAKTKKAVTIKSHHNVGGLPESLHLKLLEPLRELFKDEVRSAHDDFNFWRRVPAGVPEALDRARAAGMRLGIVSNSEGKLLSVLERVALAHRFDTVVDSHLEGVHKPDPEIFRRALERLHTAADQAVFAGDIPDVDLRGAAAAGIAAVLIDPKGLYAQAGHPAVASVIELVDALLALPA